HRLGAAASAGHRHRRRPAVQPGADALHDAGDLSLFRPVPDLVAAGARPPAQAAWNGRGARRRAAGGTGGLRELMTANGRVLRALPAVAALAGGAAGPAGCMGAPNYRRPPASSPAAFKEPPPPNWKSATPRDEIPRGKWWQLFGDPQLDALEEQVSVSNQSIAQAEAQFRAARAAAGVARGGLFPTVTAGASATRARRGSGSAATTLLTSPGSGATP